MSLLITPETKVGALLESHPEVEEALIGWVPAFSKLRNPILRRTVARVATLEQAAKIGGVTVGSLVRKLRAATGQADVEESSAPANKGELQEAGAPTWLAGKRIRVRIDADLLISSGEHPLGKVREAVVGLEPDEMVCLTSSFRPVPLIDAFSTSGLNVHSYKSSPGVHSTYISRKCDLFPPDTNGSGQSS